MGSLSLERVQFKFASIIGELCSEPDVLSQFAVWLDLRLAEYKLKGNISLDCSGEEPDPIWLKGLTKGRKRKRSSPARDTLPLIEHNIDSQVENVAADSAERLSPEMVGVKEEPGQAYPVDLVHINRNNESSTVLPQKHHELDSSPSYHVDQWSQHLSSSTSTPSKHRRVSHPTETASHQSLMSVISGFKGETQESDNWANNSALASRSIDIDLTNDGSDQFDDSALSNSQFLPESSRQLSMSRDGTASNADVMGWGFQHGADSQFLGELSDSGVSHPQPVGEKPGVYGRRTSSHHELNLVRRGLIKDIDKLARTSVKNMVFSVGTFERWLWDHPAEHDASSTPYRIFEIAPQRLDEYLQEFFSVIKLPNGMDYKPRSFEVLRWGIDRYLKSTGYQQSMINSLTFVRSQQAFKTRLKELQLAFGSSNDAK